MKLVLDTNVLVSALFWDGNERRLLMQCLEGRHRIVTSPALLAEVERVLTGKFGMPKADVRIYLETALSTAEVVTPKQPLQVVAADPADDRVLECAVEGAADLIVTGDRHLLDLRRYDSIRIVRASVALEL